MDAPAPASSAAEIVAYLQTLRNESNIAGMARFGIVTETALGISTDDMRRIGRLVKKDHDRALALWQTGIREARLLAAFTAERADLRLIRRGPGLPTATPGKSSTRSRTSL